MSIGPVIRGLFGPHERRITNTYRAIYIDIDDLASRLHEWAPAPRNILEVGCGEGAVTERLRVAYPDAQITGIDITPRVGRLFAGSPDRLRFLKCSVQEIAATEPGQYDLVILCDVLHHIPAASRRDVLRAIRITLSLDGVFVFKDWARNATPIHWLCYASDRWLTGDRVSYMTRAELREQLAGSFGEAALVAEARIAPWPNNLAILVRP